MPNKLFISYSHDSEAHVDKVLQFANFLRKQGYEVLIDQHIADPSEGWPLWMNNGINQADYVLLVCTETYQNRLMGNKAEGLGYGCRFEGKVIYNIIYNNASRNAKFLPLLLDIDDKQFDDNLAAKP